MTHAAQIKTTLASTGMLQTDLEIMTVGTDGGVLHILFIGPATGPRASIVLTDEQLQTHLH